MAPRRDYDAIITCDRRPRACPEAKGIAFLDASGFPLPDSCHWHKQCQFDNGID